MIANDVGEYRGDTHAAVWELLPWYVNGTLDDKEQATVKAHLLICIKCREELARCQNVVSAVHWAREDAWQPTPSHLDNLLGQLDHEGRESPSGFARVERHFQVHLARLRAWLQDHFNVPRWSLAVPALVIVGLTTALLVPQTTPRDPTFETLTNAPATNVADARPRFQVIFTDSANQAQIKALLLPLNASIVDGPTQQGRYTIAVGGNTDAAETATTALRTSAIVEFAQPSTTHTGTQ